jgi:tRNA A58 N-methylase Trm61
MKDRFTIMSVLDLAHVFVKRALNRAPDGVPRLAIDTTVGNGYDTAWLAQCVGDGGHVIGCDIQEIALKKAYTRLEQGQLADRVTLLHINHAELHTHIPEAWQGNVFAMMANLGYLPGADKRIITEAGTTIEMLQHMLPYLRVGGVMTVVVYPGHSGGREESEAVTSYIHRLPPTEWRVFHAAFPNQTNSPPELLAVERLG